MADRLNGRKLSIGLSKGLLLRGCLIILGLAVGAVFSELVLRALNYQGISYFAYLKATYAMSVRASDPMLGWEYPALMQHHYDYVYKTNSLGFRGDEMSIEKPPHTKRLLILGDSVVFGMSVDQGREFPALLSVDLKSAGYTGIQVINAGVIGYNLIQSYAAFRTKYSFMRPDYVAILVIANDNELPLESHQTFPSESWLNTKWKEYTIPKAEARNFAFEPVLSSFAYSRALVQFWRSIRRQSALPESKWDGHLNFDPSSDGWRQNIAALKELSSQHQKKEFKLLVVSERFSPQLQELTRQWSVPYLPLYFGEEKMKDPSLRVSKVDPHPSSKGHRWIANRLEDFFVKTSWLD